MISVAVGYESGHNLVGPSSSKCQSSLESVVSLSSPGGSTLYWSIQFQTQVVEASISLQLSGEKPHFLACHSLEGFFSSCR